MIFEPVVSFKDVENIEPATLLFIDNSNSIAAKDSVKRLNESQKLITDLSGSNLNLKTFLFGKDVKEIEKNRIPTVNFSESATDFSKILSEIQKSNLNIGSAVILSDGIINEGIDPVFDAEKLTFPIFTIGIGDSTKYRDIQIRDVYFNQFIYANKKTEIELSLSQFGFDGKLTRINLYDSNKLISSKEIQLNAAGANRIKFDYTPEKPGEIKLTAVVNSLPGESNRFNN